MPSVYRILEYIIELGPVIIIPVILLIISLIIERKPLKNLKNCVLIFIGLTGVSIMLTLFINFFQPLINTIVANSHKEFEIIDAGWIVSKAVILNSPIIFQIIIAVFVLNIVMLFLRFTRTINIDLWNYWSFLLVGSIIFYITEIKWFGILIALIIAVVTFVLSDTYAVYTESYFGISGISNPQAHTICWAPVSHLFNIIFNRIPFIKRIHISYEKIQYKLGIFSEPIIMGFILGFIIGLITKYRELLSNPGPNLIYALLSGLALSIIMILMPRAANILLIGLMPTVYGIKDFIRRRITKREIYIGLDPIILVGQPSVIALSVIIIPITVYISTVLPGNAVLPAADLIMIPFILLWIIIPSRGDIFRSFIIALIIMPLVLWITTDMGHLFTDFFLKYDMELIEGYKRLSAIGSSSNIFFWILLKIIHPIFNLFL
jgi:PTS system galactitol-specific IIC component